MEHLDRPYLRVYVCYDVLPDGFPVVSGTFRRRRDADSRKQDWEYGRDFGRIRLRANQGQRVLFSFDPTYDFE